MKHYQVWSGNNKLGDIYDDSEDRARKETERKAHADQVYLEDTLKRLQTSLEVQKQKEIEIQKRKFARGRALSGLSRQEYENYQKKTSEKIKELEAKSLKWDKKSNAFDDASDICGIISWFCLFFAFVSLLAWLVCAFLNHVNVIGDTVESIVLIVLLATIVIGIVTFLLKFVFLLISSICASFHGKTLHSIEHYKYDFVKFKD